MRVVSNGHLRTAKIVAARHHSFIGLGVVLTCLIAGLLVAGAARKVVCAIWNWQQY
jgi:hypothetical protein